MHARSVSRIALAACCLTTTAAGATASSTVRTPARAAAESRDSTVVLLVPLDVDTAASRLARLRAAIEGDGVVAVYSASDAATLQVAQRLQDLLGGELRPYDRVEMSSAQFARTLAENAIGSNAGQTVVVVVNTELVAPFLRRAMSMAGRPASEGAVSMNAGEALLLHITRDHARVSRVALSNGAETRPLR